jgi:predicted metalloendopeptidase
VHLLDHYSEVLPKRFADEAAAQRRAAGVGPNADVPRAQRAIDATQLAMGDAVGKMYVEHYFPAEQKARVEAIVANVSAAFARHVDTVPWMSPHTRALALAKVRSLYVGVGYPEHWQDYSDLVVDATDAAGNLRRVEDRGYRQSLALLTKPVDLRQWWMAPQTVGAILIFQQNEYDFPAALLLPPKFDPAASDAANYGAVGALIGHDVTHFVDMLGAEFDSVYAERKWWTPGDSVRFEARAQPLVDQFSAYHPYSDASVDGKLTRSENVADLGGLTAAFEAYRKTLGAKINDRDYVREQDREFFIGFAQGMRTKMSEAGTRTQMKGDHAPETYRVATVRNLDAWYDAFDVRPGQRLYLAPAERVRVW